jgi:hypothetical protein
MLIHQTNLGGIENHEKNMDVTFSYASIYCINGMWQ